MKISIIAVILMTLFIFGCFEKQQVPTAEIQPGRSTPVNVSNLRDTAVTIVRKGLEDPKDYVRIHAIEVITITRRNELMPMVTRLLTDKSVPVRFAAALAIGDTFYKAGEFSVKNLLSDTDENCRIAAGYAMEKLGNSGYSPIIIKALTNENQTVRANGALLLGKIGKKEFIPYLYNMMRDENSGVQARIQAVEALAMCKDDNIYKSKLWALLISKHPDDRVMGIRSMGHLGTLDAKNAILTMLEDDLIEVRLCAAEQLSKMGDQSGYQVVYNYLLNNTGIINQPTISNGFATLAIGYLGTDNLAKFLPELLNSNSELIQLSAAQSVLLLSQ